MAITVKNNTNLVVKLKKITDQMAIDLQTELLDAATEIRVRTAGGRGIEGGGFKAYEESTKRAKLGKGNKGSRQITPVNLTQSGDMLESASLVKITKTNNQLIGTIGFTNSEDAKKGKWNQEKRPWFGLSNQQKTRIIRRLTGK